MSRTAIVAVHGVGSPPEFATARGVADLLVQYGSKTQTGDIRGAQTVSYPKFSEHFIKVPTTPIELPAAIGGKSAGSQARTRFRERMTRFAIGDRDRTRFQPNDLTAITDMDVAFMRDQLAGYDSARDPYDTIEIVGTRVSQRGNATLVDDVHIFEMHWSDLSHVGTGAMRVLGALYQLVLHIAHLGRKTLDLAAEAAARRPSAPGESDACSKAAQWQAWVLRLFTVGVPVFSLLLLTSISLFLPDAIAPARRLLAGTLLLGVVGLVIFGFLAYFRYSGPRPATRLIGWMAITIVAVIAANVYQDRLGGQELGAILLFATTALILIGVYLFLINRYDEVAPGALPYGLLGLGIVLAGALIWGPIFAQSAMPLPGEALRFAALAGFEFSYLLLMLIWTLIWMTAGSAAWHMWSVTRVVKRGTFRVSETMLRTKRAMWTTKVTLAISLFGFLTTALVGYRAVNALAWNIHAPAPAKGMTQAERDTSTAGFNVFPKMRRDQSSLPLIAGAMVPPQTSCPAPKDGELYDPAACSKLYFDAFIAQSGTAGLPVALLTAAACVLFISWFVILVAVTSMHKPKSPITYSKNVGAWITDGFSKIHNAGTLLVGGLTIALSWGLIVGVWIIATGTTPPHIRWAFFTLARTNTVLGWMAYAALASAATVAAARVRLTMLATMARPAVGILLDVDNYLRESPSYGTPRAKMAERLGSLLSYITERKDANGHPYFNRIVVVSHSQGTVIAADFLRFLSVAQVPQPDMMRHDVRLITMGSPLRQLYSVHFPDLYDWIDRTDSYGSPIVADDDRAFAARGIAGPALMPAAGQLDELSPSPAWLRVSQWVNLFTAGDYVGRPIWQRDTTPNVWDYDPFDAAAVGLGRRERCLGDGTHTRYWTSCDVAQEIDAQMA